MNVPSQPANAQASGSDLQLAIARAWRDHDYDRNITAGIDTKANAILAVLTIVSAVYAAIFANTKGSLPVQCVVMLGGAIIAGALAVVFALAVLRVRLQGLPVFESEQAARDHYITRASDEEEYEYIVSQRYRTRHIIHIKGWYVNNSVICLIIAFAAMQFAVFLR